MGSGLHANSNSFEIPKRLSRRVGSEAASVYDLAVFVERAVMAPDIPKVYPGRYPNPETSPFEMKYCGCLFTRIVSRFRKTFSSPLDGNFTF
jgi:hypothetical protein